MADEVRALFPGARLLWAAEKNRIIGPVPKDVRDHHEAIYGPLTAGLPKA